MVTIKGYTNNPELREKEVIPGTFDAVFKAVLTEEKEVLAEIIELVIGIPKEEVIKTFCDCIKNLAHDVGITQTVKDVGAKKEDFPMLADKAMNDPCKPGNPREVTKEDFIELYKKAW